MVTIYTSYFYQIRFFKPYMIPLSTALWDPKWYHSNYGNDYKFYDKNGVINGLRIPQFMPQMKSDGICLGTVKCETKNPFECKFLQNYYEQLCNLDFDRTIAMFERLAQAYKAKRNLKEDPVIVLIVYEPPKKLCSERIMIHKWFLEHGYPIKEIGFTKH